MYFDCAILAVFNFLLDLLIPVIWVHRQAATELHSNILCQNHVFFSYINNLSYILHLFMVVKLDNQINFLLIQDWNNKSFVIFTFVSNYALPLTILFFMYWSVSSFLITQHFIVKLLSFFSILVKSISRKLKLESNYYFLVIL